MACDRLSIANLPIFDHVTLHNHDVRSFSSIITLSKFVSSSLSLTLLLSRAQVKGQAVTCDFITRVWLEWHDDMASSLSGNDG